jgi:3-oxoadipate enol-lactonase
MQTTKQLTGRTAGGIYYCLDLKLPVKNIADPDTPLLALIMGYGGSSRIWPRTFIDKLAARCHVLTYDNRGTGTSFLPGQESDYTIEAMAKDLHNVIAELKDTCVPQPVHILGYSMGGCIAVQYGLDYPQETASLFLLSTTAGGTMMHRPDRALSHALANPQGKTMWDYYDWTFRLMYAPERYEAVLPKLKVLFEQAKVAPTRPQALKGHSHAFKYFDATQRLGELKMPTTIMTGSGDRLMPRANSLALASVIAHANLIEIENSEHGVHIEHEDTVVEAIFNLIDRS